MSLRCLRLSLCLSDTNQLLSLSDRGWGKNVGLNTGVRFGEGWVGGSLLTLRCAEKLTHFYHGLKAPVCHTFD